VYPVHSTDDWALRPVSVILLLQLFCCTILSYVATIAAVHTMMATAIAQCTALLASD